MEHSPWIEKYRPTKFEDIVLDDYNKIILNNIISKNTFPNILFYGPPGTGKTTTIINLIKKYQKRYSETTKGLVIHLNASDDRGIDVIRNQIYQFVHTRGLFGPGVKFVILDEADYMTTNAQQALKNLIQKYNKNVKFCLICNYISRLETSLQNEFIKLHFNKLPHDKIYAYLKNIIKRENILVSKKSLLSVQQYFKSDIRSMINYIQANNKNININIITSSTWDNITEYIITNRKNPKASINYITEKSLFYNQDINTFLKNYIKHMLQTDDMVNTNEFITFFNYVIHNNNTSPNNYVLKYFVYCFIELYIEV
jgi:DNA polymerase III delta prime subunit